MRTFRGGGRFHVGLSDDDPTVVVKRGPAAQLAREALGLRHARSTGIAPRLVSASRGEIRTSLIDGTARARRDLRPADAVALGIAIRRVHESRRARSAALPTWSTRVWSLSGYRARRAADAIAASGGSRQLARQVVASLPPIGSAPAPAFRFLHGDLTLRNILWDPGPRFVDWEFWRMGDPAEDLAYLAEVNALPVAIFAAVLRGYGPDVPSERVDAWRALCALDAGAWYRAAGEDRRADRLVARAAALSATGGRRG